MTHQDDREGRAACLGILMLQTRFPRIPGDIGNAATWPFPVQYRVVSAATADGVVHGEVGTDLLEDFIAAGQALVAQGCDGIATSCGFMAPFQTHLRAALGVPVATSALLQVPSIAQTLPKGRKVGILTISAQSLRPDLLSRIGIAPDTPVQGTAETAHFTTQILTDQPSLDVAQARADNVNAAKALVAAHADLGAIVLECTNMVPYASDIRAATGLPVFSIYTYLQWFHAGLSPRVFPADRTARQP
ncbi:MAG: aspartate/glutamate racemase family protein [Oceanicola sp.]|nr:aspartate/glutamate racemase family protein [Oceanicola sp.]